MSSVFGSFCHSLKKRAYDNSNPTTSSYTLNTVQKLNNSAFTDMPHDQQEGFHSGHPPFLIYINDLQTTSKF